VSSGSRFQYVYGSIRLQPGFDAFEAEVVNTQDGTGLLIGVGNPNSTAHPAMYMIPVAQLGIRSGAEDGAAPALHSNLTAAKVAASEISRRLHGEPEVRPPREDADEVEVYTGTTCRLTASVSYGDQTVEIVLNNAEGDARRAVRFCSLRGDMYVAIGLMQGNSIRLRSSVSPVPIERNTVLRDTLFDLGHRNAGSRSQLAKRLHAAQNPQKPATCAAGAIYVVDNHSVKIYDTDRVHIATLGSEGDTPGRFRFPCGIALGQHGTALVVSDSYQHRVQVFKHSAAPENVDGLRLNCGWEPHAIIGEHGKEPGSVDGPITFNNPRGLSIDTKTQHLFVADCGNHRVQEFDADLQWVRGVGQMGRHKLGLLNPSGVCVDPLSGNVFVADSGNHRIQVFNLNIKCEFSQTEDIAAYWATNLFGLKDMYVSEASAETIRSSRRYRKSTLTKLAPHEYHFLASIAPFGAQCDLYGMRKPEAVAIDRASSRLFVADSAMHQILMFELCGPLMGGCAIDGGTFGFIGAVGHPDRYWAGYRCRSCGGEAGESRPPSPRTATIRVSCCLTDSDRRHWTD
jgi:sugar lactone lactonase YvrE